MNPWMAVIGAALGGIRANNEDKQNKRQNRVETTREAYSPFTGQHGKDVANADYMGKIMQGSSSGMAMGQQMGTGPEGPGPATAASSNATATPGAAFDGGGPTMAQQNGAPGSAINVAGYGSGFAGPAPAPRPEYVPPGGANLTSPLQGYQVKGDPQIPYDTQFGQPEGGFIGHSSEGAQGSKFYPPAPKKKKSAGMNVPSAGNLYAQVRNDGSGPPRNPQGDLTIWPPEITSGGFYRQSDPMSVNAST